LIACSLAFLSCDSSKAPSIARSQGGQAISSIIFSPDGDRIAYVEVPKFLLFGAEVFTQLSDNPAGESWLVVKSLTGKPERVCKLGDGSKSARIQWRPGTEEIILDGHDLLDEGHSREGIYVASVTGGTLENLVDGKDCAVSPDGSKLAFVRTMYTSGRGNEGLYILDLDTGQDFKISDLECKHPRWSESTGELVFCGVLASELERYKYIKRKKLAWYYGDVYLYDPNTTRVRQVTTDGFFEDPGFTPDGGKIVASSMDVVPGTRNNSLALIDKSTGKWELLLTPGEQYNDFYDYDFRPGTGDLVFQGVFKNTNIRSTEGRKDMLAKEKRTASDLFLIGQAGTGLRRLELNGHEFKERPVFSPDGSLFTYRIEYADYNTEFFSVQSSELNQK
jgi:Tol biopolymer transport system component